MEFAKKLSILGISLMSLITVPASIDAHSITFSMHHDKNHHVHIKVPDGWEKAWEEQIETKGGFFSRGIPLIVFKFVNAAFPHRHCEICCNPIHEDDRENLVDESELGQSLVTAFFPKARLLEHTLPKNQVWQTFKIVENEKIRFVGIATLYVDTFRFKIIVTNHHDEPPLLEDAQAFINAITLVPQG